eukprot:gnl/MRDRNA2_/MRDRNA2_27728_c0_seq1.p1 gnl/MRDRNA2_/MRDRNA2_27728_c0~~gnl/MRDRNA2_/MRDRNA2_27728_c0_seq1.p1  ORF type:complete len:580 (+),score=93.45 gnl/MRDRNA2_/MRDRNA2_27728_c0_seq1:80-1819(+)
MILLVAAFLVHASAWSIASTVQTSTASIFAWHRRGRVSKYHHWSRLPRSRLGSASLPQCRKVGAVAGAAAVSGLGLEALQSGSDVRSNQFRADQAYAIGKCFIRWLTKEKGITGPIRVALGQDPRHNGDTLVGALSAGMHASGAEAARLGLATTPATFGSTFMGKSPYTAAIMVTASHLPSEWNGMKFFTSEGGLSKKDVSKMLSFQDGDGAGIPAEGKPMAIDPFMDLYKESLVARMREASGGFERPLEGLHVVLNPGNGAGGMMIEVLNALGADTSGSVNLQPDGSFPAHTPNPEDRKAVEATIAAVKAARADVGIMFDTDVDRSGLIDGESLEPLNRNRLIAAASRMVLRDSPGATIVTDSCTSTGLADFIAAEGGEHFRFKKGYKNVIDKAVELCSQGTEAPLAIETSGHAALRDNHWMDDGAFLALRLVTWFGTMRRESGGGKSSLMSLLSGLREPEESLEFRLKVMGTDEGARFHAYQSIRETIERVVDQLPDWSLEVPNHEGIRVQIAQPGGKAGWLLVRESLHEPLVIMNAESDLDGGTGHFLAQLMRGGLENLDSTVDLSLIHSMLPDDW